MEWSAVKNAIGEECAAMVPKTGLIGLGSGTTSIAFIHALARRHHDERLAIRCVATSLETARLARGLGLDVIDGDWTGEIDIAFDGADAVDDEGSAIKGAGGALVREKIVMRSSRRRVLMIDERKMNRPWKECPLPIAAIPFGLSATMNHIGLPGAVRMEKGRPYLTDDGFCIIDVTLPSRFSLFELDQQLKSIPGVVETGVFFHIATEIVIGYGGGNVARVPLL